MESFGLEDIHRLGTGSIASAAQATFSPPPTAAILAGNGLITVSIMRILGRASLGVPEDAFVFGFDDIDLISALSPALPPCASRRPS